jgi:ribosomal-protein-alanine N-acetyltransferase
VSSLEDVIRVKTERLELRPLPAQAAAALPGDRETAARILGATFEADWPHAELLDVLPLQADALPSAEPFGIWVMIELETETVVGDIGFFGPPDADGSVEIGYSVVPDRRRRGYATEAAHSLVGWALQQPGVRRVVAGCEPDNEPSIRTLERISFVRIDDGRRDQLRWQFAEGAGES